jgi:putative transposase
VGYKTFQYRLYPNKAQEKNLRLILDVARSFYNMCVSERKLAWELEQQTITQKSQLQQVKHYKHTFPQASQVHSHVLQEVVTDVDEAYQAFFRRVKAGQKPGYPRFKSWKRFRSFGFKEYANGFKIDGKRLRVFGAGRIPVRWHRPYEGVVKTCRLICKAGRWYVSFTCELSDEKPLPKTGKGIGLDMGVSALLTTSDGDKVDNPQWYRSAQTDLRRKQRRFARAQKGSNNRKKRLLELQHQHEQVVNQRYDFINKLVFNLVQNYDLIAIEDLTINNMVRNHHLSKSILDAAWGYFKERLHDKAVEAGRVVVEVNPAYTSKTCSNCGAIFEGLTLADRWVKCQCGLSLDRDHNAAINILKRAGHVRAA